MATDRVLLRTAVVVLALVAISACGQKGPLRMPAPKPEAQPAPSATAPAQSDDPTSLAARRRNPHE